MSICIALRDGTEVSLRDLERRDIEPAVEFFRTLPEDDRRYLKTGPPHRDTITQRLDRVGQEASVCLIAEVDGKIIAYGFLEFARDAWERHSAELRAFVAGDWRRRGVGTMLIKALHERAMRRNVERLVTRVAAPQTSARHICERLGFRVDAVLPGYIRDEYGNAETMVVLSCTMDALWRELKDFYARDDWPDG